MCKQYNENTESSSSRLAHAHQVCTSAHGIKGELGALEGTPLERDKCGWAICKMSHCCEVIGTCLGSLKTMVDDVLKTWHDTPDETTGKKDRSRPESLNE